MQSPANQVLIEEQYFNRQLAEYESTLNEESELKVLVAELAGEAIINPDKLMEIFDMNPCGFMDKLARMIHRNEERDFDVKGAALSAALEFEDFLIDNAKSLQSIHDEAQYKLDQQRFYQED